MSDVVIRAEGLGKKYTIGHERAREPYTALRDVLARRVSNAVRRAGDLLRGRPVVHGDILEEVWALDDVSFEVRRGEALGVIGANGAGKSTLLKILSRIVEPSTGRATIRGRIASLLEVGTGFHPEMTGRENIFLNGSILGMKRAEIRAKLDEIVAFAEIEKYLDTPVKRYSSGMYTRLAFAVAAHLDAEIVLVDEVLAVGDAEFQKKCLGKIREVSRNSRTVLFVSHNMSAVQSLCSRAILLEAGRVRLESTAASCVNSYLDEHTGGGTFERPFPPNKRVALCSGSIYVRGEQSDTQVRSELRIWSDMEREVSVDLRLAESRGNPVGFGSLGTLDSRQSIRLGQGQNVVELSFPASGLANGSYAVSVDITIPFREYLDRAERCLSFDLERGTPGLGSRSVAQSWGYGSMAIPLAGTTVPVAELRTRA